MKLAYRAFEPSGKAVQGVVEAPDAEQGADRLRRDGLLVVEIGPQTLARPTRRAVRRVRAGRVRTLSVFMRQLAVLVATGTPVVEALRALERQTSEGEWRNVLADISRRVEEGAQLSEALGAHPGWFDPVARSLVAAGEQGGRLDKMLERLAALLRQQQKVHGALVGALVYPCLLMVVAVGVLGVMIGFVLPRFEGLFKSLGAPLPPTTKVLLTLSDTLRQQWMFILPALGLAAFGAWWWARTPAGQGLLHRAAVRLPGIGRLTRSFATARIARVLGVLLDGKVAMLEALSLTKLAAVNSLYVALLARAEDAVIRGENVSSALADPSLVAPALCEAIRSGERTGQVAPVLINVADFLDEDNEVVVKSLTSIIEPAILIALGLVVGLVAISMFMPLFDLTAAGGAGGAH